MKLLLAISGGIDSTVLLDALAYDRLKELGVSDNLLELTRTHPKGATRSSNSLELILTYFNHGTPHGQQAEQHVKKLAAHYNLPLHIGRTKKQLKSEADFRTARYTYLRTLKKKLHYDRIITAHTADDQAETLLLNLVRGAGLAGLAAMKSDNGTVIRPLLQAPKTNIQAYAKKHQLTWIEDPTNRELQYTRNFVRHTVIPCLAKLNPRIIGTLTRTTQLIRASQDFIETTAKEWLKAHAQKEHVSLEKLNTLPKIMRGEVIRMIYLSAIGNLQELEEVHLSEVLALAQNPAGNKQKKCGELIFRTAKEGSTRVLRWGKTAKIIRLTKRV